MNNRPETMTLAQIADRLGRSTSWLRDVRNRDDRFPAPDADGHYDLAVVALLLNIRTLEHQTDADHTQEMRHHARAMLAELESDRWDFLANDHRAAIEAYFAATLRGEHDTDRDGRSARQRAIDGSLERLRQISAPHNAERSTQQAKQGQKGRAQ